MDSIIRVVQTVFKDLVYIVLLALAKVLAAVPKKKNLWVFGAWKGTLYADNAKYEFEYISRNKKEINAVWISRNQNVARNVRAKGFKAYRRHSLLGAWSCVRADVIFLTEDRHDVSRILTCGAKVIQLWHGMGIKDIRNYFPKNMSRIQKRYMEYIHSHKAEYWMVACQEAVRKYAEAFELLPERMFITGQAKDDMFVINRENAFISELRHQHQGCKIWVYLPTHRNFGNHQQSDILSLERMKEVNRLLKEKNMILIFKPHAHEFAIYRDMNKDMSNVVFATDPKVFSDIYEFLPACDGLITDYSGIMLGYLTCEKPIVYFAYDFDEYVRDDAGFYFNYDDVIAGPVCKTWEQTICAAETAYIEDHYAQERHKLRMRFSPYNDGRNRERICQKVLELIS